MLVCYSFITVKFYSQYLVGLTIIKVCCLCCIWSGEYVHKDTYVWCMWMYTALAQLVWTTTRLSAFTGRDSSVVARSAQFLSFLYGCMNLLAVFCGFCSAWFWISHALHCHQICDCTTHLIIRSKQTCATVCSLSLVITRNLLAKRANYMLILAFCHISISM